MEKLFIVILILVCYVIYYKEDLYILFYLSFFKHLNSYQVRNKIDSKKYKIGIVTIENRNSDYIKYHDLSVNRYCNLYNYEYIRVDKYPDINIYWSKIFIINDLLKTNKYDYILWLDSDTIFCDYNIDLSNIIDLYGSKDIYIHFENVGFILNHLYNTFNAGIFIIKNSDIGIKFINDLIEHYKLINLDKQNNITSGMWTGENYEQGVMNKLIKSNEKYNKNSVILPEYLTNTTVILDDISSKCFIWHLPGRSAELRSKRFQEVLFGK